MLDRTSLFYFFSIGGLVFASFYATIKLINVEEYEK